MSMNFYVPSIEFTVETFVSDKSKGHEKMVYIAANDGSSGAEYPYETAEDIGRALQTYIETYYGNKI